MSEHIQGSILKALCSIIHSLSFFAITVDEVAAIDHMAWCKVHVYVVKSFKKEPHLLYLSFVSDDHSTYDLIVIVINALVKEGGLTREEVASTVGVFLGLMVQVHFRVGRME
jgi:hypothetical protein